MFQQSVGVDGKYHFVPGFFGEDSAKSIICLDIFDMEFLEKNDGCGVEARYNSQSIGYQEWTIDDDQYRKYITNLYHGLIWGVLTSKYNILDLGDCDLSANIQNEGYVFPDVVNGDDYKTKNYISYDQESVIRNKKVVLGISLSFDHDGIVDDIEKGYDSVDNYSSNEQELLNYVIQQRIQ